MPNITKNNQLQTSLNALTVEAKDLFQILDQVSATICQLEESLSKLKANFPFRFAIKIKESGESYPQKLEERHSENLIDADCFTTKTRWCLAWELYENTKNFRFCLISEDQEVLHSGSEESYRCQKLEPQVVYKKPLIETGLPIRLECAEYFILFINAFKEYIKEKRIAIESKELVARVAIDTNSKK